jgi:ketosteroid isomerase-like protein
MPIGPALSAATRSSMNPDELAIRELNERYFHALDERDFDGLGACFAEGAVAVYLGGSWRMSGRAAVVEQLRAIGQFAASTHVPTTAATKVQGTDATGVLYAIAHLLHISDGVQKIFVRGLKYTDRYVADDGTWLIAERRQDPIWQYEAPAMAPNVPVQ